MRRRKVTPPPWYRRIRQTAGAVRRWIGEIVTLARGQADVDLEHLDELRQAATIGACSIFDPLEAYQAMLRPQDRQAQRLALRPDRDWIELDQQLNAMVRQTQRRGEWP